MTVNYIAKGFDKDFYNFDAVFVPVRERKNKTQEVYALSDYHLIDFCKDFNEIIQGLQASAFESNVLTVKSEKTGIYYIFIMLPSNSRPYRTSKEDWSIYRNEYYISCCEKIAECINNLDVKNILIHPMFNKADFNPHTDSDFLTNTLKSSIDRFSRKNIYILVAYLTLPKSMIMFSRVEKGIITPEEYVKICVEDEIEQFLSYTNSLIRIAETETKYKEKSIMKQFYEDKNNSSCFFYEYIQRYTGTATELAENANIDNSTISKIKSHTYKTKSKTVIIALAIALDLTVDNRKRFINSAGFSYPLTEHDRFIEQQLKKKRYTSVIAFNKDIMDEHPEFVIETRSSKGYKNKKIK